MQVQWPQQCPQPQLACLSAPLGMGTQRSRGCSYHQCHSRTWLKPCKEIQIQAASLLCQLSETDKMAADMAFFPFSFWACIFFIIFGTVLFFRYSKYVEVAHSVLFSYHQNEVLFTTGVSCSCNTIKRSE